MKPPTILSLARRRLRTAKAARTRAEEIAHHYGNERMFWRVEEMIARQELAKLEKRK